jgi:hypothetical protein
MARLQVRGAVPASSAVDPIAAARTGRAARPVEHRTCTAVTVAQVVPAATGITQGQHWRALRQADHWRRWGRQSRGIFGSAVHRYRLPRYWHPARPGVTRPADALLRVSAARTRLVINNSLTACICTRRYTLGLARPPQAEEKERRNAAHGPSLRRPAKHQVRAVSGSGTSAATQAPLTDRQSIDSASGAVSLDC